MRSKKMMCVRLQTKSKTKQQEQQRGYPVKKRAKQIQKENSKINNNTPPTHQRPVFFVKCEPNFVKPEPQTIAKNTKCSPLPLFDEPDSIIRE